MNILLVSDSFPPRCGGSGWSTYELGRSCALAVISVLVVNVGTGRRARERESAFDQFHVIETQFFAPNLPGIRNYFKNERLYPRLASRLEELIAMYRIQLVHGQHVLSGPPAVLTGLPDVRSQMRLTSARAAVRGFPARRVRRGRPCRRHGHD